MLKKLEHHPRFCELMEVGGGIYGWLKATFLPKLPLEMLLNEFLKTIGGNANHTNKQACTWLNTLYYAYIQYKDSALHNKVTILKRKQ